MRDEETPVASVAVCVRVRPLLPFELADGAINCVDANFRDRTVVMGNGSKKFSFDHVLTPQQSQREMYDKTVKPLLSGCFEGYNATVFAYGQTGSGKTFTMGTAFGSLSVVSSSLSSSGEENSATTGITTKAADPVIGKSEGMIPRVMVDLFKTMRAHNEKAEAEGETNFISMSCSYLELYQEQVLDLLKPTGQSLDLREDAHKNVFVAGLHEEKVATLAEMAACLSRGATHRTTGGTKMNSVSSRSHAVFNITIERAAAAEGKDDNDSGFRRCTLRLVDLAGSERAKRTAAAGKRMAEGISINSGLLALGNVISVLGDEKRRGGPNVHVPYRDSKLTRLLQSSLGGNSRTLMIACISPADSNFDETVNCLRYANRARNIKNKAVQNRDPASAEVLRLRAQLQTLQRLLLKSRECVGDGSGGGGGSGGAGSGIGSGAWQQALEENKILAGKLADSERHNAKLKHQLQLMQQQQQQQQQRGRPGGGLAANKHYVSNQAAMELMQAELDLLRFKVSRNDEETAATAATAAVAAVASTNTAGDDAAADAAAAAAVAEKLKQEHADEAHAEEQKSIAEKLSQLTATLEAKKKEAQKLDSSSSSSSSSRISEASAKLRSQNRRERKIKDLKASVKVMAGEVNQLTQQKEKLTSRLRMLASKTEEAQKILRLKCKQKLDACQAELSALQAKAAGQKKELRLKEREVVAAAKAHQELEQLKQQRVQLVRRQKETAAKHRDEAKAREAQVKQLLKKSRRQNHANVKLQRQQEKLTSALRQKTAAHAAERQRNRDALERATNAAAARRGKSHTMHGGRGGRPSSSSSGGGGSSKDGNCGGQPQIAGRNGIFEHLSKQLNNEIAGAALRPRMNAAMECRREIHAKITSVGAAVQRCEGRASKAGTALQKASERLQAAEDKDRTLRHGVEVTDELAGLREAVEAAGKQLVQAQEDRQKAQAKLKHLRGERAVVQAEITTLQTEILEHDEKSNLSKGAGGFGVSLEEARWGPITKTQRSTRTALNWLFQNAIKAHVANKKHGLDNAAERRGLVAEKEALERAQAHFRRKMKKLHEKSRELKRKRKRERERESAGSGDGGKKEVEGRTRTLSLSKRRRVSRDGGGGSLEGGREGSKRGGGGRRHGNAQPGQRKRANSSDMDIVSESSSSDESVSEYEPSEEDEGEEGFESDAHDTGASARRPKTRSSSEGLGMAKVGSSAAEKKRLEKKSSFLKKPLAERVPGFSATATTGWSKGNAIEPATDAATTTTKTLSSAGGGDDGKPKPKSSKATAKIQEDLGEWGWEKCVMLETAGELNAENKAMTCARLKAVLRSRGSKVSGKKEELLQRLRGLLKKEKEDEDDDDDDDDDDEVVEPPAEVVDGKCGVRSHSIPSPIPGRRAASTATATTTATSAVKVAQKSTQASSSNASNSSNNSGGGSSVAGSSAEAATAATVKKVKKSKSMTAEMHEEPYPALEVVGDTEPKPMPKPKPKPKPAANQQLREAMAKARAARRGMLNVGAKRKVPAAAGGANKAIAGQKRMRTFGAELSNSTSAANGNTRLAGTIQKSKSKAAAAASVLDKINALKKRKVVN